MTTYPKIIQGGMGIGVSNWILAREVARSGQLGVVSGTALNSLFVRRLQDGDEGGHLRRALKAFPFSSVAETILNEYFIEGGKPNHVPYKRCPVFTLNSSLSLLRLTVVANYCEVYLAKEGHAGVVGINLLEKVQLPNLPSLFGAMMAGVDYVLMGAGIPREIPGALDLLAKNEQASLKIPVEGSAATDDFRTYFDPKKVFEGFSLSELKRPNFLPIIASATLALSLAKKATGRVDGFVVEGPTAGGHNAPPRGVVQYNQRGEPVYGPKDEVDLKVLREIGLPFWLAGSYGTPEKLKEALSLGAAGVQVGTAFAFCDESGFTPEVKLPLLKRLVEKEGIDSSGEGVDGSVYTDPRSSPTGFPFKAILWNGSLSETDVYEERPRICDLGYLRHLAKLENGNVVYRCPAEPVEDYLKKGGEAKDTEGRKCLCNALMANIGHAQKQASGYVEKLLITAGDDYLSLKRFVKSGQLHYTAREVIDYLLGKKSFRFELLPAETLA